ncbi:MAG: DNA primase, partial [Clostridia bacterium]|nr:DNA primase [Clostridia bacterium]
EELRKIQSQLAGVNNGGERVKSTNVRAVKAEEALIGYLFRNPEMSESVRRQLPPERMTTDFNRRLYTSFTDRAMSGKGVSFTDFSGEFSSEENSRIAAIMANHANDISSNSGSEYISVILSESEKLSAEDLANESPEAIQEYLNKIKNKKSKK